MLTIVVPMAGRGGHFASAGYKVPEPLIPLRGPPMIELVIGAPGRRTAPSARGRLRR
jgi:hypothetical protein